MDIAVEISFYPLERDFVPPIQDLIDRLQAHASLKVVSNSMSTQVSGEYDTVMAALARELRPGLERDVKSVYVMKLLGPLPAY